MRLAPEQVEQFHRDGWVIGRGVVPEAEVQALVDELDRWIEESRTHRSNYGETPDGKARFDLEAGHGPEQPRLRRVANPADVSEAYRRVLWDSAIADCVAQLIGPDVKFHHCKLNNKLPAMTTRVDWHQDHPYDPHTNDSVVVISLMLDDSTVENGCLRVVPGSHRERYTLFEGDRFVGKVSDTLAAGFQARSLPMEGKAGDVCFAHTWIMHGSDPNRSTRPRRLLICDYTAADAFPLTPPAVPSVYTGRLIRGTPTRMARLVATTLELPQPYRDDSFFGVQGQAAAAQ